MRETKFRAWDKKKEKWHEDTFEAYRGNLEQLHISLGGRIALRNTNGIDDESLFRDRFVIQQFTGLHDKNGKEIYEGDVLGLREPGHKNQIVLGAISYVEEFASFRVYGPNFTGNLSKSDYLHGHNVERFVIGNIYETPELLK